MILAEKINSCNKDNPELIKQYFKDIEKYPVLSSKEENELAKKVRLGDSKAREKLINSNLRFVVKVARSLTYPGFTLLDLINEGNIGLAIAADKFDPSKNIKFISYAVFWIRQSILKAIQEKSRSIRLPINKTSDLLKIKKAIATLEKNQEQITIEDISKLSGVSIKTIELLKWATEPTVSLNEHFQTDDTFKSTELIDNVKSPVLNPEEELLEREKIQLLYTLLNRLQKREKKIITMRYGLGGHSQMSLSDIGTNLNITKERVRQIEKFALSKLNRMARESGY